MTKETESGVRSARDVIDDAIRENMTAAWLLYSFAVLFVCVGMTVLIIAAIRNDPLSGVLGTAASSFFWPSMTAARRTRKENIAIRLLEAPLARADTSKSAAEMLRRLVSDILADKRSDGK